MNKSKGFTFTHLMLLLVIAGLILIAITRALIEPKSIKTYQIFCDDWKTNQMDYINVNNTVVDYHDNGKTTEFESVKITQDENCKLITIEIIKGKNTNE